MPAVVAIPQVVEELLVQFADFFPNEPSRWHFAEYITGLLIAEHKTVSGIARESADTTDQSCLNGWLTEAPWDSERINAHRLEWLRGDSTAKYRQDGVIAIDNTLIDRDDKLIEDVGWFWDHADQRHRIAHDYLFANHVHPSGKHYPLEFRRFRKRDQCADASSFKSHTVLCQKLVEWVIAEDISGDFAFDSYFTNAPIMNHIHRHQRTYVGDLKANRVVEVSGVKLKVSEWTATLLPWRRTKFTVAGRTQWYYTKSVRLPNVDHPVSASGRNEACKRLHLRCQPCHAEIQLVHRGRKQKLLTPPVMTSSVTGDQAAARAYEHQSMFGSELLASVL